MIGKFTVAEVEERTGVPAGSLRQWERRYGFPTPERSASGYRYYSESDVALIQRMRDLVAEGVAPSRAAALMLQAEVPAAGARPPAELSAELEGALRRLDTALGERVLSEAFALHAFDVVLLEVVAPALQRVGDLWEAGSLDVATEHFISNYIQSRLRSLFALLAGTVSGAGGGRRLLVACAPRERHEIGALIVALLLRRAGFEVIFLGADTPVADLVAMAESQAVDAVLLSMTLAEAAEAVAAESEELRSLGATLVLGGAAASQAVAERVGGIFLGNEPLRAIAELPALR